MFDNFLGKPLIFGSGSNIFQIRFYDVAEFRSTAEPCFKIDGTRSNISEYMFECIDSKYSEFICPFGVGPKEKPRHFCIYTETVVLEVLSVNEPDIKVITNTKIEELN